MISSVPMLSSRAGRIRFVHFMQSHLKPFCRPPGEVTIDLIEATAGWRVRRRVQLFHSAYIRGRLRGSERRRLVALLSRRYRPHVKTVSPAVGFEIRSPILTGANEVPERKTPRLTPENPIPARFAGYDVSIRDFSRGGFRVEHDAPILLNTRGRLEFTLPDSSERVEAEGRSGWTRIVSFGKEGVIFQSGIELPESSATLDYLITHLEPIFVDEPVRNREMSDQHIESRRAPRLLVQPPVRGRFGAVQISIKDISIGGVRVEHEHALMLSSCAPLMLRLPSFQASCTSAQIVWSRFHPGREGSPPSYQSGIRVNRGEDQLAEAFNRILGFGSGHYDSASLQIKRTILQQRARRRSVRWADLSSFSNPSAVVRIIGFGDEPGRPTPETGGRASGISLDLFRRMFTRSASLSERKRKLAMVWSAASAAALACALLTLTLVFRDRPLDPHYAGTLELLHAYESRTPQESRDYGQPLYRSALAMLEKVDPKSRSAPDAKLLSAQLRASIDAFHRRKDSEARRVKILRQRSGRRDDIFLQSVGSANPGTAHAPVAVQSPDRETLARQAEMIRRQARQR